MGVHQAAMVQGRVLRVAVCWSVACFHVNSTGNEGLELAVYPVT